jgi:HEAT repeat protein
MRRFSNLKVRPGRPKVLALMKLLPVCFLCCILGALAVLGGGCAKEQVNVNVSAAVQGLKSPETDAKVNACTELAKAGPAAASATPDLIPLLKDKDPLVRRLAAYALGQIGPKASSAIPALREKLNDPDPNVASDALNALRFIGDESANIKVPNVMVAPEP